MWILPLIGYLGMVVGFCFLTLAIASGLYYLSELVEEHTVLARRLLSRLIYLIITLHILLYLIDSLPLPLCSLSIFSHLIYAANLRRFPIVKLSDPIFLASCVLVGLNHWLWFRHFSDPVASWGVRGQQQYYYDQMAQLPSFTEIASYFGLCVWLVPFALFVSLSAGENVLPSMGSEYATGSSVASSAAAVVGGDADRKLKNKGMAKAVVDGVREWVGETGELMGFWRGEKTRRF
ncbi:erv26 super protein [Onygenales sp. PD_40]|nr:erv26 super protein [Onygenales sp. PD_40]